MEEVPVVNIDRLRAPVVAQVTVNGVNHDAHQPAGRLVRQVRVAQGMAVEEAMRDLVRECVPTLPADDLADLNQDQVAAIFGLVTAGVKAVEATFPNVVSPTDASTSAG